MYGPNVLSCVIISGPDHWLLIGIYIPPSEEDGMTLSFFQQVIHDAQHSLILLGGINAYLCLIDYDCSEDIATALTLVGLQDLSNHFPHPCRQWTWSQWQQDHYICSVTDYIHTCGIA